MQKQLRRAQQAMSINPLFFVKNKKVLDFAFKNESDLCKCKRGSVDFSAFYVADLIVAYASFYGQLILGYSIVHPQLPQTFAQPPPEFVLLFRGHRSKVPLTTALNRPIYRAIPFLCYF